jgi:nicotinamidase-related amidase
MHEWREFFQDSERATYEAAGFGSSVEPHGQSALLVIDVMYGFTGHRDMDESAAIAKYPNACGSQSWRAVDTIADLLDVARVAGVPIFYTQDSSGDDTTSGVWQEKHGRVGNRQADDSKIVDDIAPRTGDVVLHKKAPSAFFGTDLAAQMEAKGVESLFLAGTSTSGCVRASVVDAFSYKYSVFVVEDAVFDRSSTSHCVSLYEMHMKYATVVDANKVRGEWTKNISPEFSTSSR